MGGEGAAYGQQIRDVDITVRLGHDGSADVTQVWDVYIVSGTEWYIPIQETNGLRVGNLSVSEDGVEFQNEGAWKVDRTIEQKARRCGINRVSGGVELCWGVGSYGNHLFKVSYTLTGLVIGMSDYDAFNTMFLNEGLSSAPEHAKITVLNNTGGPEWTSDNVKVWGFGCNGTINVEDGRIVMESDDLVSSSSMIMMARFDKGSMSPTLSSDKSFSTMEARAKKGSAYRNTGLRGVLDWIMEYFLFILFAVVILGHFLRDIFRRLTGRIYKPSFFGASKITSWFREIPLSGDLDLSYYALQRGLRIGSDDYKTNIMGSYFLRWIMKGYVTIDRSLGRKDKDTALQFNTGTTPEFDSPAEKSLWDMCLEVASRNGNNILEANEFKQWSRSHYSTVMNWDSKVADSGREKARGSGYISSRGTTDLGKEKFTELISFKNFLNDFTLSKEREAIDVALWQDYLVFASLFGIADKIESQFKKLYPEIIEQMNSTATYSGMDMRNIIYISRNYSNVAQTSALNAYASHQQKITSTASRGGGGFTSIGGGGGFSGGGFGGGSR